MAEMRREHNPVLQTMRVEEVLGGRSSPDWPDVSEQAKRHAKEAAPLKRTVGGYAVANDA